MGFIKAEVGSADRFSAASELLVPCVLHNCSHLRLVTPLTTTPFHPTTPHHSSSPSLPSSLPPNNKQNLSPSPYLDPHLFRYSKHLSPIIGLRNSPATAIRFQLARQYPGFSPSVVQQQVDGATGCLLAAGVGGSGGVGGGGVMAGSSSGSQQPQQGQQHHNHAAGGESSSDMLQLDVNVPPTVQFGGEEVMRRQLHLFHPSDPFVLVVVQTPGQAATLNIYCRM